MRELHRPDDSFGKLFPTQTPRPGFLYVPTQFSLPFTHCGKQYTFHTLTKQCVEAALPASAEAGGEYDELIRARFLVPQGTDEFGFYRSVLALLKLHDQRNRKPAYTILPTLGCNARCVYCFQQGMEQTGMTDETVEDTLRFILNDCGGKKITLSWFGGEPLLRQDVIDRISRGVWEAGIDYRGLMVSNGSLITPEMIGKMKELWRLERIQISMDGTEQDYIARKRYLRYRDDYHTVIEAVDRMSEAGIQVQVRNNVDENNIDGIPQFLNDLKEGVIHRKNVSVYLTPLYETMRGEYSEEVCTKILTMQDMVEAAGFAVTFERFNRALPTYHCMADAGGIVIAPNGDLHCCEDLPNGSKIGNVREGVAQKDARKAFIDMDRVPERCRTCAFLPDCIPVAACPKHGFLCRDSRMLLTVAALERIVDQAENDKQGEDTNEA